MVYVTVKPAKQLNLLGLIVISGPLTCVVSWQLDIAVSVDFSPNQADVALPGRNFPNNTAQLVF